MTTSWIGARIGRQRDKCKLSQAELAQRLGFGDRKTVSAIETGKRHVSAKELLRIAEVLKTPVQCFTDPFMLLHEGNFNWRQTDVGRATLDSFEERAGSWVAAYRALAPKLGRELDPSRMTLRLNKRSSYEEVSDAGAWFARKYELGVVPAKRLVQAMEKQLGILVLMVDMPEGISGAACHLSSLYAVLINREEPVGRRNFDLAHELFHILTWNTMPPARSERATEHGGDRIEQLANVFASAVLMPAEVLREYCDWSELADDGLVGRINDISNELLVSATALKWRLVHIGAIDSNRAEIVDEKSLRKNGQRDAEPSCPAPYSRQFIEVVNGALETGRVSTRRAARLLELDIDAMYELFGEHGIESAYKL